MLDALFFFHPDFTVDFGISPNQSRNFGSRGLSPPVGNCTLPWRTFKLARNYECF